jgi:transposase
MDRGDLEKLLGEGLTLAQIGRRFGLHEATVSYWVKKYGLEAVNRTKHAAHGGIGRENLAVLVDAELSIAQIAESLGRSKGTIRHWLKTHDLKTYAQQGRLSEHSTRMAKAAGMATVTRRCQRHGVTDFWLEGRGYYRCKRCRMESVSRRRRTMKVILVAEAGGRCSLCGYDRCTAALHFHHVDPSTKRFHLSMQGVTRSLARARAEMEKCVLLCANCHAEVEAGITSLPGATAQGEVA